MHVLRIEHAVDDYDAWKQAFDGDPIGRKDSGVVHYRVMRAVGEPNHVMIDLEFNTADEAEKMHEALKELWGRIDLMKDPRARSAEIVETGEN